MAYGNALVQLEAHLLEKRILLVDDEAELVEMVRAILRAAGLSRTSRSPAAARRRSGQSRRTRSTCSSST